MRMASQPAQMLRSALTYHGPSPKGSAFGSFGGSARIASVARQAEGCWVTAIPGPKEVRGTRPIRKSARIMTSLCRPAIERALTSRGAIIGDVATCRPRRVPRNATSKSRGSLDDATTITFNGLAAISERWSLQTPPPGSTRCPLFSRTVPRVAETRLASTRSCSCAEGRRADGNTIDGRGRTSGRPLQAPSDRRERYFEAMVGFTQPFFITPCDGRKLR